MFVPDESRLFEVNGEQHWFDPDYGEATWALVFGAIALAVFANRKSKRPVIVDAGDPTM